MQNKSALVAVIFALLVFVGGGLNAYADIPANERAALIALYNSTNGDNWTNNSGWKQPPLDRDGFAIPGTEGSWYGITLNEMETTVEDVNLYQNNLSGTIPPEIGNLLNLNKLLLHNNQLTGVIPQEIGNLTNLSSLYLNRNELTGSIPQEVGNLSSLGILFLDRNDLTGSIPATLGNLSNLSMLHLWNNELTGSIPPELGNLTKLTNLSLYGNDLTGNIPSELGNLSNLSQLYLHDNQLTGSIPKELGLLSNLWATQLQSNQLMGEIPSELGNLSNLSDLRLHDNQLTGSIPAELGNLTELKKLFLGSNQLTGEIPSELTNLTNLEELSLSANQLSDSIPPELGNLSNLQRLYLSGNQLTGTIPKELANLANLKNLGLSGNLLTGGIPPELGNLSSLEGLSLRANSLTGSIPASLMNLTNLDSADIGYNALYTDDEALRAFLDEKDPDWEDTQTVAPADVSLSYLSDTSLQVSWTPISFTIYSGGYGVMYSETSGGPYTLVDQTANKSISQMDVTGLDPNTTYYFVVQTRTEANIHNQNTVLSDYSKETVAATQKVKGDVYWDGKIGLRDAIAALQILDDVYPGTSIHVAADVNGDGKIGLAEALFALRSCLGLIYVDEETKDALQEVVDCMALAMDESTKDAESLEKMTGLSALMGLADAQAAAGGGIVAFVNYLLNELEFPCGTVARETPLSTTIVFTFTGEPACNNVTGTIKVTPELSDSTLSYNVEYIDVQTEGCLIDGDAATTMTIEGSVVTATHTFDQMSMCGDEFDGTVTVVYDIVTGEVISVSTEQNAYTIEGCDATMDLVISYTSENGINGTAIITMDEGTYEIEMSNIKIDETCGLPTSGSMTLDGIVLDFSTTSCENPVVMVTMEGQTFNLNLETGEIS